VSAKPVFHVGTGGLTILSGPRTERSPYDFSEKVQEGGETFQREDGGKQYGATALRMEERADSARLSRGSGVEKKKGGGKRAVIIRGVGVCRESRDLAWG